ncbi:hypothetical protein GCM10022403_000510 [Streptomyces coacervatus]|uniref:Uncharacterized protein n=1 Tax=Streptomyces coacervatus TaxID=647381 RepID=A0ABP7GS10_9ACTN|nr:hypothetical protein [Streptomyces coacervatus]MDF2265103.1 hypothetical protein [Streptomyces coacervatus]
MDTDEGPRLPQTALDATARREPPGALNLRASPDCRLAVRGCTDERTTEEVPEAERPPLPAAYREKYGSMPTVSVVLTALPDPADHPVFRLRERP